MMKNTNSVLMSTLFSIGLAAVIFCLIGVIYDQIYNGNFQLTGYAFTRMVVGTLVIGLGFGLPTFIYGHENLPLALQALIHMGIGCAIMTLTAAVVGWIPSEQGLVAVVGTILGEIAMAFLIWALFYHHQKKLVRQMNRRIAEKNM